jgi:tRNA A-37 threonylcarbamoyl transferase component Bud32
VLQNHKGCGVLQPDSLPPRLSLTQMISAPPQISGLVEWRPLAAGGFSTVWQARQESLNRLVAVKVDDRKLTSESERRRFLREAGAAGRMSGHPGIVTVHDAGILDDNRPYLVMELCPGGSLSKWLKPEERKTQERVREVGVRIADALAAAHARGVLHRDVKPANILIDAYDNPGLADFGLAIIPEPGSELSETLEALTPAYAPREVIYGEAPTEASDVYSLAATLYALLCGKAPRWSEGESPSLLEVIELQDKPIERLPGVHREFMDLLLRALSDEPSLRPTAAEFHDELAALDLPGGTHWQTGRPINGRAAGLPAIKAGRPPSETEISDDVRSARRRLAPAAVAAALVVILAAFAVAVLNMQREEGAVAQPPPITTPTVTGTTPTASPSSSSTPGRATTRSPTPTPKKVVAPPGFTDCSTALGQRNSFCVTEQECWQGVNSMGDLPIVGNMADCNESHVYQTFAAGQLPGFIQTQSEFDANTQVQRLCSVETLEAVLPSGMSYRKDWQIVALPEQPHFKDSLFRCWVGFAEERNYPVNFKVLQ